MTTIEATRQTPPDSPTAPSVVVGVDTHQRTHHACVVDHAGRRLADCEFEASAAGYRALLAWAASFGTLTAAGVESTGSYGAGLTQHLLTEHVAVYEVSRPDKTTRARQGKSDPIDAESAARQVLAGTATGLPKVKTGIVEAIRAVKIPRDSAVKDRGRAACQLRDLITTAPDPIREELLGLSTRQRVARAASYRPDRTRLQDPIQATKHALRSLARRILDLDAEIAEADRALAVLVPRAVPSLLRLHRVGIQSAARLAITAGENIDRMRSEAAFAKLTGVAPIPASSGKTHRHRLNRGGDRHANSALHLVVIGRLKDHQPTRDYLARRHSSHFSKRDAIRCLKRYLAREVYQALRNDLLAP
jgi:hypothetical protein